MFPRRGRKEPVLLDWFLWRIWRRSVCASQSGRSSYNHGRGRITTPVVQSDIFGYWWRHFAPIASYCFRWRHWCVTSFQSGDAGLRHACFLSHVSSMGSSYTRLLTTQTLACRRLIYHETRAVLSCFYALALLCCLGAERETWSRKYVGDLYRVNASEENQGALGNGDWRYMGGGDWLTESSRSL